MDHQDKQGATCAVVGCLWGRVTGHEAGTPFNPVIRTVLRLEAWFFPERGDTRDGVVNQCSGLNVGAPGNNTSVET